MPVNIGSATDLNYPDWTNLVDTWRDIDAEWLRNRSVSLWASAATRATGQPAPMKGALSARQDGYGDPEFWTSSAWETVRYPNLDVISDASSVTLRRLGAGSGVQLVNDGSVNTVRNIVGTGGLGYVGDQTGIALHVGAKTVKLSTDATGLTVDSPVSITGALTLTGALTVPSETVTGGLTVQGNTTVQGVAAASLAATGAVSGATVTGGDAKLATNGVYGAHQHRLGGTGEVGVGSDSTVRINGASLAINPPTTFAAALNANGAANFAGTTQLTPAGKTAVQVAGIIAVSGNVAPSQNAPDGTLYVTY